MTKQVIVSDVNDSLEDISRTMKKYGVGSVIAVDKKAVKKARGIVTERDIVYKVIALGKHPSKMKVSDVMSKPLRVITPDATLEEAAHAMKINKVKRLPVVNGQKELVGILSETDIMRVFPSIIDLIEEHASLK